MTPVVTDLIPSRLSVDATSTFTLQVRGTDFEDGCVIVWNNGDEPTTFVSENLVTTGINAATNTVAVTVPVAVRNPGGELSNAFGFTFTPTAAGYWPTIDDFARFTGVDASDATLQWSLDASIRYGITVLGSFADVDGQEVGWPSDESTFQACMDYAGSLYTQRIGQADFYTNAEQGTTPQQRYRRTLLAARYVAIA